MNKILVCIPTWPRYHNGQRIDNWQRSVHSIARQTYKDILPIVAYGKNDPTGYQTRNKIIAEHPECNLIAYCDDDCWWEPTHLESLVHALGDGDAAFSRSVIHLHFGRRILWRKARSPRFCKFDLNELLHRREILTEWPDDYNADWLMMKQWISDGRVIRPTSLRTVHYSLKPDAKAVAMYLYSQAKHLLAR